MFNKIYNKNMVINAVAHSVNDVFTYIIVLLMPLLKSEFGLSYTQAGLILTIHIGIRSVFTYLSGHLGDKYDKRIIISVGFLISAIFLASMVFIQELLWINLSLIFLAIGSSTFHPLGTALIGEEVRQEKRSLQIGLFEASGVAGIVLASFTFGFLVQHLGWRVATLLVALPGFPLAIIYLKTRTKLSKRNGKAERIIDSKYILFFLLARGVRAFGIGTIGSFLTIYITDHLGVAEEVSSWFISILFFGVIVGHLFSGWVGDRYNPLNFVILSTTTIMFLIIGITLTNSILFVIIQIACFGFIDGIFFTPQNNWLTAVSTVTNRGRIMGAAYLIDGISVTISPLIFGWLADHFGLVESFRWAVVPVFLSIFIYLAVYRKDMKTAVSL